MFKGREIDYCVDQQTCGIHVNMQFTLYLYLGWEIIKNTPVNVYFLNTMHLYTVQ